MKLEFETDESRCLLLSGRTFENVQFKDLQITGSVDREIRIENCKFLNCSTSHGTCFICGNVTLDRVVISDLECGDSIHIDSEVKFTQVVIAGRRPGMLKITPLDEDGFVMLEPKHSELQLDISDFYGAVEIIGISAARIKKDATRQATVQSKWLTEVNWKLLGIDSFSYWKIFVEKVCDYNVEEGVFSLPDPSDVDHVKTMREKEILEAAGIHFE